MTIESILRKHITRETHKGTHARVVVHLAVDIRAEIYRELEEGMEERPHDEDCEDKFILGIQVGFNSARSRALKIVKGEEI